MDKGDKYESHVSRIVEHVQGCRPAIRDLGYGRQNKLSGKSGVLHQVDVSFVDPTFSNETLVLIECKNRKNPISLAHVKVLKATLDDVLAADWSPSAGVGILTSTTRLQTGAATYAEYHGIVHQQVNLGPQYAFRYDTIHTIAAALQAGEAKVAGQGTVIRKA